MTDARESVSIRCQCGNPEHDLVVNYDKEDYLLWVDVHLHQTTNPIKRLWYAFKYVLGFKNHGCCWDACYLETEQVEAMLKLMMNKTTKYIQKERHFCMDCGRYVKG